MRNKLLQRLYILYAEHFFYRTSPFIEESFHSYKSGFNLLRSIFQFPRNLILSIAYYKKTSENIRKGIYKRLGVKIGYNTQLGKNVYIDHTALKYVEIGDNVSLGDNVTIIAHTQTPPYLRPYFGRTGWGPRSVKISRGTVIEDGAIILPSVTIEENATILTGSVVTKNVERNSIVGGMPANIIHGDIASSRAELKAKYNEIIKLRENAREVEGNIVSPKRILLKLAQKGIFPSGVLLSIYKIFGLEINGNRPDLSPQFGWIDTTDCGMLEVENDVHISPCVTIITKNETNKKTIIRRGSVIYAGATLLPGVEVNDGAIIGAGSVVSANVPSHTVFGGSPATVKRNIREKTEKRIFDSVEITPFKFGYPGAFCISSDFELNWAWMYPKLTYDDGKFTRKNFDAILKTFEKYNIPVTWCTVGHLFLKGCKNEGGKAHPDMPRPKEGVNDWYRYDPCTNWEKSPSWYAPDLIEKILKSKVGHEIGCHTFSHVYLSEDFCQPELADAEMKKCVEVMSIWGLKPRSFAFPGNREGNYSALENAGIIAYRSKNKDGILYYPRKINNMWDIPANLQLNLDFMIRGKKKRFDLATRFIDEAIETNKVAHFWFHPSFLGDKTLNLLEPVFQYIAEMNRKNKLWLATMSEIATYSESRERIELKITQGPNAIGIEMISKISDKQLVDSSVTLSINIPLNKTIKNVAVDNIIERMDSKRCYTIDTKLILTCSTKSKKIDVYFA